MLRAEGLLTKTGRPFDKNSIAKLLANRGDLGEAVHEGTVYPGEHDAIVSRLDGRQAPKITLQALHEIGAASGVVPIQRRSRDCRSAGRGPPRAKAGTGGPRGAGVGHSRRCRAARAV